LFPSYQELLEGKKTFDEDDSRDSLDCGLASALDAGTSLDTGTEPSLEVGKATEGALELSSVQAEKRIARLNKPPIAVNIFFFIYLLPNGYVPNIYFFALSRNLFIALIRLTV
jgi:hypothetical protein